MNGIGENASKQIVQKASCMMWGPRVPIGFWPEAIRCSTPQISPMALLLALPFRGFVSGWNTSMKLSNWRGYLVLLEMELAGAGIIPHHSSCWMRVLTKKEKDYPGIVGRYAGQTPQANETGVNILVYLYDHYLYYLKTVYLGNGQKLIFIGRNLPTPGPTMCG